MDIEELGQKIDKLSKDIDEYHKNDKKRADKSQWEYLGFTAAGFAATIISTHAVYGRPINAGLAVILFITGVSCFLYAKLSSKFKEK